MVREKAPGIQIASQTAKDGWGEYLNRCRSYRQADMHVKVDCDEGRTDKKRMT